MAESHVVSALVNKRTEMVGVIARTEQQLGKFRAAFIVQHGDDNREELGPGPFNYMPQKTVHQGWTKPDEGALLFITVDGAWDINWVDSSPTAKK
jgi:hypothetical protein